MRQHFVLVQKFYYQHFFRSHELHIIKHFYFRNCKKALIIIYSQQFFSIEQNGVYSWVNDLSRQRFCRRNICQSCDSTEYYHMILPTERHRFSFLHVLSLCEQLRCSYHINFIKKYAQYVSSNAILHNDFNKIYTAKTSNALCRSSTNTVS